MQLYRAAAAKSENGAAYNSNNNNLGNKEGGNDKGKGKGKGGDRGFQRPPPPALDPVELLEHLAPPSARYQKRR